MMLLLLVIFVFMVCVCVHGDVRIHSGVCAQGSIAAHDVCVHGGAACAEQTISKTEPL